MNLQDALKIIKGLELENRTEIIEAINSHVSTLESERNEREKELNTAKAEVGELTTRYSALEGEKTALTGDLGKYKRKVELRTVADKVNVPFEDLEQLAGDTQFVVDGDTVKVGDRAFTEFAQETPGWRLLLKQDVPAPTLPTLPNGGATKPPDKVNPVKAYLNKMYQPKGDKT